MSPALAAVAILVAGGAVVAVSAREARAALIGLAIALGLGPFLADPLPTPAVLGARVVTGVLVAYLLRAVVASAPPVRGGRADRFELGSRVGWPADAALAVGGGLAGLAISTVLAASMPRLAPSAEGVLTPAAVALATGLAAIAVGVAPAFLAGGSLRTAIGLLVLIQGFVLARTGLAGQPGELEQLGINGLILALGTGGALLASLEARGGDEAGGAAPHEARGGGAPLDPADEGGAGSRRRVRLGASR